MKRLWISVAAVLAVAACASDGGYGPARRLGEPGYAESRIETARFRVVYQGEVGARPAEVEALALRRAAEITLEQGYEWFVVDDRDAIAPRPARRAPRVGIGVGVGAGRGGFRGGVGTGAGVALGPPEGARLDLLIRLGRGVAPQGAYEARSLLEPAA
jgi:hypothetical protein